MNRHGDPDQRDKTALPTSLVYGYVSAIYLNCFYLVVIAVLLNRGSAETGPVLIGCCSCFLYLSLAVGTIAFLAAAPSPYRGASLCGLAAIWWAPILAVGYSTLFR